MNGGVGLFLVKIRDDLQITFAQGGWLSASSTLVYAFMQIPAGYLVDRFGPRRLFFIGALGTTLGTAGVNIASFHLGRSKSGGDAIALLQLDQAVNDDLLEAP